MIGSPRLGDARGATLLLVAALAALAACAAKREPLVTAELEQPPAPPQGPTTLATLIFPPRCDEQVLPAYPETMLDLDLPPFRVRVAFLIDKDGAIRDVGSKALDESDHNDVFVSAAEEAITRWACRPAARPPRPDDEVLGFKPIDYRTSVVFHFYSDAAVAEMEPGPGSEETSP